MREEWREYRRHVLRYLRRMPVGMLIALIPFTFGLPFWLKEGAVLSGLGITLVYGVTMPLAIWLGFSAFYGVRTWLEIKNGSELPLPGYFDYLVGGIGLVAGTRVSQTINHRLYGAPAGGSIFLLSLLFGGVVCVAFFLYSSYQQSKAEAFELRAAVAESRCHALEQQMRPHFLFNALNSLAELIESGREDAAETAYKLSDLYRQILANSGRKTASLSSELAIVRAYLELEQLRFGPRLRFEITAPEEIERIFLPSLMLQTLVENAVKHGIAPSIKGGQIRINIAREDGGYRLTVANTGAPLAADWKAGIGLANTQARLDLLYGDVHQFALRTEEPAQTRTGFRFSGDLIQ